MVLSLSDHVAHELRPGLVEHHATAQATTGLTAERGVSVATVGVAAHGLAVLGDAQAVLLSF